MGILDLKDNLSHYISQFERISDPRWKKVRKSMSNAKTIIDLGCGNSPIKGATVALDLFMKPEQRAIGAGQTIDAKTMGRKGVSFVNASLDAPFPFRDKQFDFAYSAQVFEHLEDPVAACREMQRIARAGVVITPNWFAEILFGRPYHNWLVMQREDQILFCRKRSFEDRPFGQHPNPFDRAMNLSGEFDDEEYGEIRPLLRRMWKSNSPLIYMIHHWEGEINAQIID